MLLFPIEFALQITVLFVPVREELLRRMSLLDPIKASLSTRYRQAARSAMFVSCVHRVSPKRVSMASAYNRHERADFGSERT